MMSSNLHFQSTDHHKPHWKEHDANFYDAISGTRPTKPGKTEMAGSVNKMSSNLHFQAMGHHKSQWKEHIAIGYDAILNVALLILVS